jgi:glycerol-3-phosphate acyltransferase PlsX
VISDDEPPIKAMRYGTDSSMRKSIDSVKVNQAKACVSSGNTGALMVMAKLVLGELPGIKRPAIIAAVPTIKGKSIVLDLGANTECDELNMFQFALMGNAYAKIILDKKSPTVGLLNVGVEAIKGTSLQKKTHELLLNSGLNYSGYIEGCDIAKGVVDVVVIDGFTGNIMIKFGEGIIKMLLQVLHTSFRHNLFTKFAGLIMKSHLKASLGVIDPNKLNGAMFIGVNGIVVKSHGSSNSTALTSAILAAYSLAEKDINREIKTELRELSGESGAKLLVEKIKQKLGFKL